MRQKQSRHSNRVDAQPEKPLRSTDQSAWVLRLASIQCALFIIQLVVMGFQLKSMRDQGNVMLLDQRAWLSIGPPSAGALEPGRPFHNTFTIKNTGKTPARTQEVSVIVFVARKGSDVTSHIENPREFAPKQDHFFAIAPGDSCPGRTIDAPILTGEQIEKVKSGELKIYFVAQVVYTDPCTADRHTTRRSCIYEPRIKTFYTLEQTDLMD